MKVVVEEEDDEEEEKMWRGREGRLVRANTSGMTSLSFSLIL